MVEHVVDRHRADEMLLVVDDRSADEVVRREVPGHGRQAVLRAELGQRLVDDSADQAGGRFTKELL